MFMVEFGSIKQIPKKKKTRNNNNKPIIVALKVMVLEAAVIVILIVVLIPTLWKTSMCQEQCQMLPTDGYLLLQLLHLFSF